MKIINLVFFFGLLFFVPKKVLGNLDYKSSKPILDTTDIGSLVEEMNKQIVPLEGIITEFPNQSFTQLDELKSIKIIGMGEATHGTKEFFQMKQRLFKFFVEHFNHKVLAFEMDYSEALIFEEYIQTGKGNLTELMKNKLDFWTWCTSEIRDLFEWMKEYNIGKKPQDRLHLFGIDCQTFDYNVPELMNRIALIDSVMKNDITKVLNPKPTDINISQAKAIGSILKSNKGKMLLKISTNEYDEIEHISDIIIQTVKSKNDSTYEGSLRDQFMAENTIWLSKRTKHPISIWAHNDHIKKGDKATEEAFSMGFYIDYRQKESYKNIGFSFAEGSVTAYNQANNSLEYINVSPKIKTTFSNRLLHC
jgi:erythromycin esterase